MKEMCKWIASVEGLSVSSTVAARAFARAGIETVDTLVNYLISDKELSRRPKGIGEENYKLLRMYAEKYFEENEPVFVGLTCTNGVSFAGSITKQNYAEFCGVIEALQIWFESHKIN